MAEGVETEAQYELVRELGCDRVQGYYIAKPQPLDAAFAGVRSPHWPTGDAVPAPRAPQSGQLDAAGLRAASPS